MIEARGLVKRYGSTMAVDDLSFSIRPGMVTGFLGPNGAGKTTTMRMILGLDAPTQGSVTVAGACPGCGSRGRGGVPPFGAADRPAAYCHGQVPSASHRAAARRLCGAAGRRGGPGSAADAHADSLPDTVAWPGTSGLLR
jgi:energy-coupling factor transporter ATP-binding protein EcfA2